jgi:hypothetical protein
MVEPLRDQENPLDLPNELFSHYSIPAFDEDQQPKSEYGESIKNLKFRVPANAKSMVTPVKGLALRTYLRAFRGVHKPSLHLSVATYEAMIHAKRVTPELIQRMCIGDLSAHTSYT